MNVRQWLISVCLQTQFRVFEGLLATVHIACNTSDYLHEDGHRLASQSNN